MLPGTTLSDAIRPHCRLFPSFASKNARRVILEPAGALAVAGLKKYVEENNVSGSTFVAITSGANMDFNRLRVVSERADDSERTLMVTIPETPGSFRAMYAKIWPRNVTEFTYRFNTEREATVLVSFQPMGNSDFLGVMEDFRAEDFPCEDLSHNELAKTHIRHLAGGRSNAPHERLFRFHFPEVRCGIVWFCCPFLSISASFPSHSPHHTMPSVARRPPTLLGISRHEVEYLSLSLQELRRRFRTSARRHTAE